MTDYSKKGHYYIEEPRFELKHLMPLLPKGAHILDMGAGNGNNTKLFLQNGYKVTAVEPNPAAIAMLSRIQKDYPDRLTIVEASLDTYKPKQHLNLETTTPRLTAGIQAALGGNAGRSPAYSSGSCFAYVGAA